MNSTANEHLELGKQAFFRHDLKGAAEEFRKALCEEPDNLIVLGWLAITLAHLRAYDEALSILDEVKESECAESHIAWGIISEFRDQNPQLAIEHVNRAISVDPNNELAYAMRGLLHATQKRQMEATSDLNRAMQLNESSYFYTVFGNVRRRFEDTEGALIYYDKAIGLDPNYAWAWGRRGYLKHFSLDDKDGALADYNRAIELDPNYAWAWYQRGHLDTGYLDDEEALTDYNKAIELDPEYRFSWAGRGSLRAGMGDVQGGQADLNKAIELDPNYAWAWYRRGELKHISLDDKDGALVDYSRAIELDPEYKFAWADRGSLRAGVGDAQGGVADLNKAIELDPNYAWAWYRQGELKRVYLDDKDGALTDYNRAIELDPEYKFAWAGRGVLREGMGDAQGALNDFNRALAIDNDYSWALDMRANVYKSLGNYEFSLSDRSRYYSIAGIPRFNCEDPVAQDVADSVFSHLTERVLPQLKDNGEKLIEYWECVLHWGADRIQSLNQGKPAFTHTGKYGFGYVVLSDRYLRVISLGDLSKKYGKQLSPGIGQRLFLAVLNNYDVRRVEKSDKLWTIPFKDIRSISQDDELFYMVTASETWEIGSYFGDEEYLHAALEYARTGHLRNVIDVGKLRIKPKRSGSEDEIFAKIERLASFLEKGIITQDEFDQKKKELLARL